MSKSSIPFPSPILWVLLFFVSFALSSSRADVESDWQAYVESKKQPDLKSGPKLDALQRAKVIEDYYQKRRAAGLAFLEEHPDDPRRWIIVWDFVPTRPLFVQQWGELNDEGKLSPPQVDEAAAEAWQARVAELKAAMEEATDLPDLVIERQRVQARALAERDVFYQRWNAGTEMAPDFEMEGANGAVVKVSDFRGKTVILDFWAPWCGPCRAAMPHVQDVAETYADQGVVVLASCTSDTRANYVKFVAANREKYPDFIWGFDPAERSPERASRALYGVSGIPTQFIIGPDGRVKAVLIGYKVGENILEAALAQAGIDVDPDLVAKGQREWAERRAN